MPLDSMKDGSPHLLLSGRVAYMSFVWGGAEIFMEKLDFYSIMHSKARVLETGYFEEVQKSFHETIKLKAVPCVLVLLGGH